MNLLAQMVKEIWKYTDGRTDRQTDRHRVMKLVPSAKAAGTKNHVHGHLQDVYCSNGQEVNFPLDDVKSVIKSVTLLLNRIKGQIDPR